MIQISDINDSAGWAEIKKLNKDEAKDKVVDALTKQQKLKENILSEIKGKPRFDFLRKKLEFENNMFNPENFDNLWNMITEKIPTLIYPYALPAPQLIYTETKICEEPCEETEEPSEHKHKERKEIFHVFNGGEIHRTTVISSYSYSSPAPAQRATPKHSKRL